MDNSQEYIKMCIEAVRMFPEMAKYSTINIDTVKCSFGKNCGQMATITDKGEVIPLFQQDQLQDMIKFNIQDSEDWEKLVFSDYGFSVFLDTKYNFCKSFEQVWLCVVMEHRYNKTWGGKKWLI